MGIFPVGKWWYTLFFLERIMWLHEGEHLDMVQVGDIFLVMLCVCLRGKKDGVCEGEINTSKKRKES